MNDRTVVAWDGKPESRPALDWAVARELPREGTVVIVRVLNDSLVEAISGDETRDATSGALRGLDDQVVRLSRCTPDLEIATQIVRGDPRSGLERFSSPSNVLVLGTHDASTRQPLFAWSLTARLIAEARGPLVVVPAGPAAPGTGVVVGVDGSPASAAAAAFAADEAVRMQTSLTLVHAWLEPVPVTIAGDIVADDLPWLESAHRDLLERETRRVQDRHADLVLHSALEQSTAAGALDRHARSAVLLVVGARGYGPLRGHLLGSVSTSLLTTMPCPVAITGPGYVAAVADSVPSTTTARS